MLPNHQEYIRIAKAIFFLFLGMIKMNNYNVPPENNAYHMLTYIRRQKREMTAARRLSESSRKKKEIKNEKEKHSNSKLMHGSNKRYRTIVREIGDAPPEYFE